MRDAARPVSILPFIAYQPVLADASHASERSVPMLPVMAESLGSSRSGKKSVWIFGRHSLCHPIYDAVVYNQQLN